jgi:hypothetical protein
MSGNCFPSNMVSAYYKGEKSTPDARGPLIDSPVSQGWLVSHIKPVWNENIVRETLWNEVDRGLVGCDAV